MHLITDNILFWWISCIFRVIWFNLRQITPKFFFKTICLSVIYQRKNGRETYICLGAYFFSREQVVYKPKWRTLIMTRPNTMQVECTERSTGYMTKQHPPFMHTKEGRKEPTIRWLLHVEGIGRLLIPPHGATKQKPSMSKDWASMFLGTVWRNGQASKSPYAIKKRPPLSGAGKWPYQECREW